jgi:IS30 family transposase
VAKFNETSWPSATRLCPKTIYRYICKDMIEDSGEQDLLRKGKLRKTHGLKRKHHRKGAAERSIDKRPEHINNRREAGNWELPLRDARTAQGEETSSPNAF